MAARPGVEKVEEATGPRAWARGRGRGFCAQMNRRRRRGRPEGGAAFLVVVDIARDRSVRGVTLVLLVVRREMKLVQLVLRC